MSARFNAFVPFILEWETEYLPGHARDDAFVRTEHDPNDPGGTTKYGIDQRSHPTLKIEALTRDDAIAIYLDEWIRSGCETMAPKLGEVLFNARVNCGAFRARLLLAESQSAIRNSQSASQASAFLAAHRAFYQRLAGQRPIFQKYLHGWLNRLEALARFLKLD